MNTLPDELDFLLSAARASFRVAGVAERWSAVQERLHPRLVALAEQLQHTLHQHYPRPWSLYEMSYKTQRYINRGQGVRLPVDDYHVAFDRPPRGAGLVVSISGAEHAILIGLQLWGARKPHLRELWATNPAVWQPLVARIAHEGQARFRTGQTTPADSTATAPGDPPTPPLWIDRYLATRSASYLWAGFVYPWDSLQADALHRFAADLCDLFPLNEALMEQAEERAVSGPAVLREERAAYSLEASEPPIETLIERMQGRGFVFSETLLRAYHIALHTRPLVILTGISGTGKTRLTRLYADAVHHIAATPASTPPATNPYYLLVAVQPDWHNARDLLGYYNALTGCYHPTPFLRFLLHAQADPARTYYVCLDELNLARPEYYLAPLLSAMETVDRTLDLGIPASEAQTVDGELLPNLLRLPLNLRLIGTVNVDESTYALSDKLLDRANVIELSDIDPSAFRVAYEGQRPGQPPLPEQVWQVLTRVHTLATAAGQPFGYRTLHEMVCYVEQASGILPPLQALDMQMKQKVLPRLRGEHSPRLRQALGDLLALLRDVPLPESAARVQRMLERLEQEGFTDFYG